MDFPRAAPDGLEIRHLNDNKLDCRLVNLVYGTRSENKIDSVRNGIHPMTRRTRCPQGHEYTEENTYWKPRKGKTPQRVCIKCTRSGIKHGAFNRNKTHCPKNHKYTPENTYVNPKGSRECRTLSASVELSVDNFPYAALNQTIVP